ncbi:MAG: MATE family efflux transporter [Alphaproteobacteria bacterium]|nr:MATE family efflux transporter [Alphaproteobacteria bacterium]
MAAESASGSPAPGRAPRPLLAAFRLEARPALALAGPVIVARAAILTMFTVDTLFTGATGADQLAVLGLGQAAVTVFMLASVGILQGVIVMTAQAVGAKDFSNCGAVWRAGLVHAGVLGILVAIPSLFAETAFLALGQDPAVAAGAGPVTRQFAWGLIAMLPYICTGYFLEGIGRPHVGMTIMLVLNALNILLDAIFAVGWGGFVEPMGAVGAVMTTSALRWLGLAAAVLYVVLRVDLAQYGLTSGSFLADARRLGPRLRRLGAPMAASQALESGAYATIVFLAGMIGASALAAHQVTMNLVNIAVMIGIGMSAATAVRVGRAVGAGDRGGIQRAGWTGILIGGLFMLPVGLLFASVPEGLGRLFMPEGEALTIARHTIAAAGVLILFSGTMGVTMGALRGTGDTFLPMALYAAAYWGIAIPMAVFLGFPLGLAAPGLVYGAAIGAASGLTMLALRFLAIAQREPRRA